MQIDVQNYEEDEFSMKGSIKEYIPLVNPWKRVKIII